MYQLNKIFLKKKILIYGLGISGYSSLNFLKKNNHVKFFDDDYQKFKNKNIGFFSYIFIFLISIIAFFLIVETFEYQINNIFPNFENYIIYVYETLNNILILIKDLFKSY